MNENKTKILLLLLFLTLPFPATLQAQDTTSVNNPSDNAPIVPEDFESSILNDDMDNVELWEMTTTPESGNIIRIRDRNSRGAEEVERYHYLHMKHQNVSLMLLETLKLGAHPWRRIHGTLSLTSRDGTLHLGYFRANMGEGWTVQSSPSWSLPSSPLSPFYRSSEGVSPNSSAEPFRGWFGSAFSFRPGRGLWSPSVDVWAGTLEYDARHERSGALLYSQPVSLDRRDLAVNELHSGVAVTQPLGSSKSQVSVIRGQSHFSELLEPTSTARYRFADGSSRFGATGLAFRHMGERLMVRAEGTRQDHQAEGGSAALAYRTRKLGTFSTTVWRATNTFATLHARPYLAFGSDPAGQTGYQAGWQRSLLWFETVALTYARSIQEPQTLVVVTHYEMYNEYNTYKFAPWKEGAWLTVFLPITNELDLDLRYAIRNEARITNPDWPEINYPRRRSVRATLSRSTDLYRIALRLQAVTSSTGEGRLVGMDWRAGAMRGIGFAMGVTYLHADSYDSRVTVIEPAAPGSFPFVTLSGEHLRLAGRLDLAPWKGIILWASGAVDKDYAGRRTNSQVIISNRVDTYSPEIWWGLGFDWRPTF